MITLLRREFLKVEGSPHPGGKGVQPSSFFPPGSCQPPRPTGQKHSCIAAEPKIFERTAK